MAIRFPSNIAISVLLLFGGALGAYNASSNDFRFAILGDRTGEAQPGVYEEAWHETDADHPDFVITTGDTIQGENDLTMDKEWQRVLQLLAPYRKYRIFFIPGNHDVWSIASAQAFEKYTKRPLHYGFNFKQAHFVVLDDSRSDQLPAEELAFLRNDLEANKRQSLKFVFSHRPTWLIQVVFSNPNFPLHQLAKRYGVKYVIAGHLHQMQHYELDGITYLLLASSGGHLRDSKQYKDGWFFQHTLVTVHDQSVDFRIKELAPPFGQGRITRPADWGPSGLENSSK
ncbi:MAG: metallophosphoesterase [Acidobacteriaceae bacterium]|nr:metallophosphoesterase [Acidobacteriaceae bacterium]